MVLRVSFAWTRYEAVWQAARVAAAGSRVAVGAGDKVADKVVVAVVVVA